MTEATRKSLESKRKEMAYAYLTFGTFRKAERETGYSKSSIHSAVQCFIKYGGFDRIDDLKTLVSKNKSERHVRGGAATKRKYDIIRTVLKEPCADDYDAI